MYIKTKGEEPMKKTLAIMLALIMVLALVPTVAFAAGNTIYVDANNGNDTTGDGTETKPYKTVEAAAKAAVSGDTIMLGEGNYTLYGVSSEKTTKTKDLTFVGQGAEKTFWNIGAEVPDPANYGTEYNGDYSFDGAGTITFRNMTLRSGEANYLGFIRADKTIVENCTVNGKTFYWGYTSATFTKTTFNCPAGDYAVWTYSSPIMTFESCTFNSKGKVINVYNEGGTPNVEVNFNNCTVNSENLESLSVMNINDVKVDSFTINFNGKNTINGIKADGIEATDGSHASAASNTNPPSKKTSAQATCSKLFEFNIKHGSPTNKTTVNIDNTPVWKNGQRVGHKYTDGYKDNAFEFTPNTTGGYVKTCKYCGYTEPFYGELSNEIELERTVRQNSNPVLADAANPNKYKVANSSNITVDYTATMDMRELVWQVGNEKYDQENKYTYYNRKVSPWELLMALASEQQIDGKTEVILNFTFDKNIDLGTFKTKYEADKNVLMLTSDMFEIADGGVQFDTTKNTMTITCKWKENANTNKHTITLKGNSLPVTNDWNGSKQIDIKNNRGCVSGTVHIKYKKPGSDAKMIAETVPNVAANVQVASTTPPVDNTIQIPIVGGCKTDEFTLYYGGGSSGDSHSYYYPTATPVPVIVIPPKTGDMTVWQSILHFLGIR